MAVFFIGLEAFAGQSVPGAVPPGTSATSPPPASQPLSAVMIGILVAAPVLLVILWIADVIRPRSPARAGVRQLEPHPWWIWLAAAVLVFMAGQFVAIIVHASLGVPSWMNPPLKAQVIVNASMALSGSIAGVVLVRMLGAAAPMAGMRARWSDLAAGLWCFVLTYPIVLASSVFAVLVVTKLQGQAPDRFAHETLRELAASPGDPWAWGLRLTAILLVPTFEEFIYRIGLQSALLKATGRPWVAIIGTSAVFTAAHASVMPIHALAVILVLSLGIGLAYERTKRLGVPIAMHAMFNLVNVLMAM